jgi:hypothetical protein
VDLKIAFPVESFLVNFMRHNQMRERHFGSGAKIVRAKPVSAYSKR